ncbi:hypothetical protein RQN9TF_32715 (plasmid) [Rhodococcus qingshengii]|uniref:hypothetical protein n=1 Tax=Rhodococcus TaxID=1827 RepID=UPI001F151D13|nr:MULTISPECIES: hypothetical protein [Rhodococcus]BDQ24024.1 hypothetical protein RQN9TF_32715 [Rhodococcus qingshengii]
MLVPADDLGDVTSAGRLNPVPRVFPSSFALLQALEDEWSPEQIVGHLRLHHSGDEELAISHETIYRSIYTTRWDVIPQ